VPSEEIINGQPIFGGKDVTHMPDNGYTSDFSREICRKTSEKAVGVDDIDRFLAHQAPYLPSKDSRSYRVPQSQKRIGKTHSKYRSSVALVVQKADPEYLRVVPLRFMSQISVRAH